MSHQDNSKNLLPINSIASLLTFTGENIVDFLNNLLISQLKDLKRNAYHYTALCNPKGRIISSFWINIIETTNDQKVNLICPKNMIENTIQFFNMRKFRLKIKIELSDDFLWLNTNDLSIHLGKQEPSTKQDSTEAFYLALFQHNLPWIDVDNTEKFIPQHINLDQHDNVMSFTKGCYPGQEIIARLKYLGKIKKRMMLLSDVDKKDLESKIDKNKQVSPMVIDSNNHEYKVQVIASV